MHPKASFIPVWSGRIQAGASGSRLRTAPAEKKKKKQKKAVLVSSFFSLSCGCPEPVLARSGSVFLSHKAPAREQNAAEKGACYPAPRTRGKACSCIRRRGCCARSRTCACMCEGSEGGSEVCVRCEERSGVEPKGGESSAATSW
jgi:hypothetical protein